MMNVRNETPRRTVRARISLPSVKDNMAPAPSPSASGARLGQIDFQVVIRTQSVIDAIGQAGIERRAPQKNPVRVVPDDLLGGIDLRLAFRDIELGARGMHPFVILRIAVAAGVVLLMAGEDHELYRRIDQGGPAGIEETVKRR